MKTGLKRVMNDSVMFWRRKKKNGWGKLIPILGKRNIKSA